MISFLSFIGLPDAAFMSKSHAIFIAALAMLFNDLLNLLIQKHFEVSQPACWAEQIQSHILGGRTLSRSGEVIRGNEDATTKGLGPVGISAALIL